MDKGCDVQAGVLPERPSLSVCMIVKDEEETLPRCLKSVQGVADELIVVDTGSTDNTVSVAEGFGAKVFHFEWRDDFAVARNESMIHATGDWILQIDADEELLSSSVTHLAESMSRSAILCYAIMCDNGLRCAGPRFGWFSRLFRRHPRIRYARPYHETVDDSVQGVIRVDPRWQVEYEPDIVIRHYGYDQSRIHTKHRRGLSIMESHLRANPDDSYILSMIGAVCCNLGRYEKAEQYLKRALEIDPDMWLANYNLGLTLRREGKLDDAVTFFKRAIAIDSNLAEPYGFLGVIYAQKGMLDSSIAELKRGLAINPELSWGLNALGLAYINKGLYDDGIAELQKAVAIDPDFVEAHKNLALGYKKKDMLDESIAEYKLALSLAPEDAEVFINLGLAYVEKGALDEAVVQYERAIEIDPNLTAARINLGIAYYMEGRLDDAVIQFRDVIATDRENADAHFNLGVVYRNKGMINEAIDEYRLALVINPEFAEAHNNLAVAHYTKGDYELALEHCDKAVELGFQIHPQFLQDLKVHRRPAKS